MSNSNKFVVSGASGHLGQLVLDELLKNGVTNFIATTRNPEKLSEYALRGVDVREADFSEVSNDLIAAFKGAERLLLISTDALGQREFQHKNAIEAAKKAGVKHIVYTSWPHPESSLAGVAGEHLATEKLIEKSGLTYTILRNYPYAENLLMALPAAVERGVLAGTAGQGKVAYVTRQDCAKAAAKALISNSAKNQTLDISGPEAVSYQEIIGILKSLFDVEIKYVDMPEADYKKILVDAGVPGIFANLIVSFDLAFKKGEVEKVSSAVKELTGETPMDMKSFLNLNKKTIFAQN